MPTHHAGLVWSQTSGSDGSDATSRDSSPSPSQQHYVPPAAYSLHGVKAAMLRSRFGDDAGGFGPGKANPEHVTYSTSAGAPVAATTPAAASYALAAPRALSLVEPPSSLAVVPRGVGASDAVVRCKYVPADDDSESSDAEMEEKLMRKYGVW